MMPERPTFSPMWHRVRALRPRLRPHVQISRQRYRGQRAYVAHDPTANHFFRLSPVGYEFVALLDGRRTVEEVWHLVLSRHGDAAPTQGEVIELLGQLYNSDLLAVDMTPETEQLLRRGRERVKRRLAQQAIGIMYFRLRLFNPDRLLSRIEPLVRPVLNRWGLAGWCLWVGAALWAVLPRWEDLKLGFEDAIAPANWPLLLLVFVVIKAVHELGHGVICKRFGGHVPEMGVMLLVLVPAPYVDASSCWAFPSKWRRIAVGAGGMIFELAVAALAAQVWLRTGTGETIHQLAFNAMLTASVATVLFNANPLMRFDGYYMLSDLLEIPNLMMRSARLLTWLAQKHLYRVSQARPPTTDPREQAILLPFGIAALAYRVFLFFTITLFVMGKLFAIGLVLAIWTATAWFVVPVGKFLNWLATSPHLAESRRRAWATTGGLVAAAFVLLGLIPMPDSRKAWGVVESTARAGVHVGTDGFVQTAHVRAGDAVRAGDPILTCDNPDLRARLALARAQLDELLCRERAETASDPARAQVVRAQIAAHRDLIAALHQRLNMLVICAPHDGVVVPGVRGKDPATMVGTYVQRGEFLCEIVDPAQTRIAATLASSDAAPLLALPPQMRRVQVRPRSDPHTQIESVQVRFIEAGQHVLPHPALGVAGGGVVPTDPREPTGTVSRRATFIARIEGCIGEDGLAWRGVPGERVRVRFVLPPRPLLSQWLLRLRQLVQGRADV